MGRPSKLTDAQWAELDKRRMDGESRRALAKEFGITETALRNREEKIGKLPTVQKVAAMIVETDRVLKSMPISAQVSAHNLADKLKAISNSLASAAELGSATAHRLAGIANAQVQCIDDADPLNPESVEALKGVSALTRLANDSASIAINLLNANKETVQRINEGGDGSQKSNSPIFNLTMTNG